MFAQLIETRPVNDLPMFAELIESNRLGCANCLLWQDGQIIFRSTEGYKDPETKEPVTADTIFRIASMTKPITSVLVMMLYEENKLQLEDPITKWFPQFGSMKVCKPQSTQYEAANRHITIFDLLTHTAGFTYSGFLSGDRKAEYLRVLGADIDTELSNEEWVNGLASLPLISQPGEMFNYGRSTDLLGMLIAKIEGASLSKVMKEKLFDPLGMVDTFFEVPENKSHRLAANIGYDDAGNLKNLETVPSKMALKERPSGMEYESGGQGLWSTIDDYLKFARIFIDDSTNIIKKSTKELICTNHLTPAQRENSRMLGSRMFKDHFGFGLGVAVITPQAPNSQALPTQSPQSPHSQGLPIQGHQTLNLSIPCTGSIGSIGWPGAYGGWWSADPKKKSAAIFLTHSMAELPQLSQGIGLVAYEAIDLFAKYVNTKSVSIT